MQPTPDEVVDFAYTTLMRLEPALVVERAGLSLQIQRDADRSMVWNLHDIARLAPSNPEWRDEVLDLASQVAERVTAQDDTTPTGGVGLRLRPDARVPAELRTGEYAAEPALEGLWVMYGECTAQGVAVRPWRMMLEGGRTREDLRTIAAATTLGPDFTYMDMMAQMSEGIPVFTNAEFHPHIAAALLMPAAWWNELMSGFRTEPKTLLAMIPSPSRIFWTPVDEPAMVNALRSLIPAYEETEEELLSTHVYRFDGTAWRVAAS